MLLSHSYCRCNEITIVANAKVILRGCSAHFKHTMQCTSVLITEEIQYSDKRKNISYNQSWKDLESLETLRYLSISCERRRLCQFIILIGRHKINVVQYFLKRLKAFF